MPWEITPKFEAPGLGLHQAHTATASANSVCCALKSDVIFVVSELTNNRNYHAPGRLATVDYYFSNLF
jgi:hypothetical protein